MFNQDSDVIYHKNLSGKYIIVFYILFFSILSISIIMPFEPDGDLNDDYDIIFGACIIPASMFLAVIQILLYLVYISKSLEIRNKYLIIPKTFMEPHRDDKVPYSKIKEIIDGRGSIVIELKSGKSIFLLPKHFDDWLTFRRTFISIMKEKGIPIFEKDSRPEKATSMKSNVEE